MDDAQVHRAVEAARSTAERLSLTVDTTELLHRSNKLSVLLSPCDVVARVAPAGPELQQEVDLALQLAGAGCPVLAPDPRARQASTHNGFAVSLWPYHRQPAGPDVGTADYAAALHRLHEGMRAVPAAVPRFTDRVEQARSLVADPERTPGLTDADRGLLGDCLADLGRAVAGSGRPEQLLHGEPHPGNLLRTSGGPLFIDLETCCRGPVEFDLAHAPEPVADGYPDADGELLRRCRLLVLAMVTAWRWDRDDAFPDGRRLGTEGVGRLREELGAAPPSGGCPRADVILPTGHDYAEGRTRRPPEG